MPAGLSDCAVDGNGGSPTEAWLGWSWGSCITAPYTADVLRAAEGWRTRTNDMGVCGDERKPQLFPETEGGKVTLLWPPSGREGGKSGLWCVKYGRVVCYSKHAWYLLPAVMLCAFLRMGGLNSRQVGI